MSHARTTSRRQRPTLLAGLAATLWLVVSAGTAGAAGISLLGGITDPGNKLAACRPQVLAAEKSLFDRTGSNLFVVLVPDAGTTDLSSFVDATWNANPQLTPKDILFIGTTDQIHGQLLQGNDGRCHRSPRTSRTPSPMRCALRPLPGDWCAATLAVASGYETAIAGAPAPPSDGVSGGGGGGFPTWLIVVFILALHPGGRVLVLPRARQPRNVPGACRAGGPGQAGIRIAHRHR